MPEMLQVLPPQEGQSGRDAGSRVHDAAGASGRQAPVQEQQGKVYLIYLLHRMLDFRLAELQALLDMVCGDSSQYEILGAYDGAQLEDEQMSPFCCCWLPSDDVARRVAERSMLVKAIIELWGAGDDFESMKKAVRHDPGGTQAASLARQGLTFKVHVDLFGSSLEHEAKVGWIHQCTTLVPTTAAIKLRDPDEVLWLVVSRTDKGGEIGLPSLPERWFYGRQVALSNRLARIGCYELPARRYLGPTSMDCEIAFLMANMAHVQRGHLVFDPFVGTGSCLVAAAELGARTMGADIDLRVVRDGKIDKQGRPVDVWSNFDDYGLPSPLGLLRADAHRMPWRPHLQELFDAVVCDPPYGVRAGGRKGAQQDVIPGKQANHIARTEGYALAECLRDLLDAAARLLRLGGRLVYFLPTAPELYSDEEVPRHPALQLVANSEQVLTTRYSRRLITMRKARPYDTAAAAAFHEAQGQPRLSAEMLHALVYEPRKYDEEGELLNAERVNANRRKFRGKNV